MNKNQDKKFDRIKPLMVRYKKFGTISDVKQDEVVEFDGKMFKIGWLVANLRQEKRKGLLDEELIGVLDCMGMRWTAKDSFESNKEYIYLWLNKYGTLENLNSDSVLEVEGRVINVGGALASLRSVKKKGNLTSAQEKFLEMWGIVWEPRRLETNYQSLIRYKELFGSIGRIKINEVFTDGENEYKVGRQVNHIKTKYNKGLLSEEEIEFFESLGIDWGKKASKQKIFSEFES